MATCCHTVHGCFLSTTAEVTKLSGWIYCWPFILFFSLFLLFLYYYYYYFSFSIISLLLCLVTAPETSWHFGSMS